MDSPNHNFGETSQELMQQINSGMKKAFIIFGLCTGLLGVGEICRRLGLSSPRINSKPDEITALIWGMAAGLLLLASLVVDCTKAILVAVREKL